MTPSFRRYLIVSITILLGSVAVCIALFLFLSNDLAVQAHAIAANRNTVEESAQALTLGTALARRAGEASHVLTAMNNLLPSKDALLEFPKWMSGIARGHNVVVRFSFQGDTTNPTATDPGSIGFSIDASGSHSDLSAFLEEVEAKSTSFLVTFSSLNFRKDSATYRASAHGKVFFQ